MSKKEKSIVTNLQTAVTTSTKHQTSSFSQSANEKTEDDLLGGLSSLDILECGHHFCVTCIVTQKKEEHVSCGSSVKRSDIFKGDADTNSGSVQHADHDGELSAERKVSGGKSEEMANKSYNKSSRKKKSKTQVFAFLYHKRPVVAPSPKPIKLKNPKPIIKFLPAELLNRLYMLTNVNRGTHELVLKAQKSSSEEAEAELSTRGPDTVGKC
uniref:Zf-C3HC4 domain-containing protein n=1 Tax=Caenorhabditis japonica TaxID=281687 RepID=A0A8R1E7P9_CAEJA